MSHDVSRKTVPLAPTPGLSISSHDPKNRPRPASGVFLSSACCFTSLSKLGFQRANGKLHAGTCKACTPNPTFVHGFVEKLQMPSRCDRKPSGPSVQIPTLELEATEIEKKTLKKKRDIDIYVYIYIYYLILYWNILCSTMLYYTILFDLM